MNTTIQQTILNGPNRFSRVLGHGTVDGLQVRLRIRAIWAGGVSYGLVEYTDATRESDNWHRLGDNYSLSMPCEQMLQTIPCVAQFRLTPALLDALQPTCPHCDSPVTETGCSNGLCEATN